MAKNMVLTYLHFRILEISHWLMTNWFRQDFLHGSDLKLGLLAVAEVSGWADLAEILWRSGLFWLPVQDWYHRDDDPLNLWAFWVWWAGFLAGESWFLSLSPGRYGIVSNLETSSVSDSHRSFPKKKCPYIGHWVSPFRDKAPRIAQENSTIDGFYTKIRGFLWNFLNPSLSEEHSHQDIRR